jgi:hypothetical protein
LKICDSLISCAAHNKYARRDESKGGAPAATIALHLGSLPKSTPTDPKISPFQIKRRMLSGFLPGFDVGTSIALVVG